MGGGGSSPATIFCKYSIPDKPMAAFANARGSSQVIVRVRGFDMAGNSKQRQANSKQQRAAGIKLLRLSFALT